MIIIRLSDGLGNQMFQYAYGLSTAVYYGQNLKLDCGAFTDDAVRNYALVHLAISNGELACEREIKEAVYTEESCLSMEGIIDLARCSSAGFVKTFISGLKKRMIHFFLKYRRKNVYLNDFSQGELFFYPIKERIKGEFQVITEPSEENQQMLQKIQKTNAVCVHIRRGDYLNEQWKDLQVCTKEYYLNAIEFMKGNEKSAHFFIFSNSSEDLQYIKKEFGLIGEEYTYVDLNNPDYEELRLMYNCKHFIISNSTFSWWAQYLGKTDQSKVIAPRIWIKGGHKREIYQKDWILM